MDPLLERLTGAARGTGHRARWIAGGAALVVLVGVGAVVASTGSGGAEPVPVTATPAAARPSPSATPLLVQVVGAVRHPGVVAVAAGARALDAIAAAGGATAAADESAVDLAARVADGQRIEVPVRGRPAATSTTGTAPGSPVSLSTATADQLETLPHIGPAMAARIVAYRQAHGGFASVADLQQVSGIGPRTYADLKDLVVP